MTDLERRFDNRIPIETYLTAYICDQPTRGFTTNISETGLYLNTLPDDPLPPFAPVGIELALPGLPETLWLAGEMCFDKIDDYFHGRGVRFTAMAGLHGRMLREYCYRSRKRRPRWS